MPAMLLTVAALCLFLLPVKIPLGQVGVVSVFDVVKRDVRIEMMRLGLLFEFGFLLRQLLRILLG
jgi:hypothetical protein